MKTVLQADDFIFRPSMNMPVKAHHFKGRFHRFRAAIGEEEMGHPFGDDFSQLRGIFDNGHVRLPGQEVGKLQLPRLLADSINDFFLPVPQGVARLLRSGIVIGFSLGIPAFYPFRPLDNRPIVFAANHGEAMYQVLPIQCQKLFSPLAHHLSLLCFQFQRSIIITVIIQQASANALAQLYHPI